MAGSSSPSESNDTWSSDEADEETELTSVLSALESNENIKEALNSEDEKLPTLAQITKMSEKSSEVIFSAIKGRQRASQMTLTPMFTMMDTVQSVSRHMADLSTLQLSALPQSCNPGMVLEAARQISHWSSVFVISFFVTDDMTNPSTTSTLMGSATSPYDYYKNDK
ncbi:hypothetical protein AC249_AIPGENE21910 [Exaiptasia diaphana]|nr:hypothetical protein AC249_AIPGENE21910 [Exaiptasia diaphana]